ncbi:IS3 family transposase [Rhodococcus kroppenstedtii]|uniref:IS3 family transposase n=1 Tax=Rhodococcoides kroppenstedtii TaxID=293050 RepID=UPI0029552FF4|nr:IS3 family transposase [Rhodococcus kroppenstedtii]MDV7199698.1 IS3 family transposase [Rhodococcus kroppenstedtii]
MRALGRDHRELDRHRRADPAGADERHRVRQVARTHQAVLTAAVEEVTTTASVSVVAACALVGIARSTYYRLTRRYAHYRRVPTPIPHRERTQPAALTADERRRILDVVTDDDYADLSVVQTYWRAFDDGRVACSQRTFYRVAAAAHCVGDRRRRRGVGAAVTRRTPVVAAHAVGDLWSWDITELRGPRPQDRYKLYLAIDVFSRYPVAWRIEHTEDRHLATAMFAHAIEVHGPPAVLHADNGAVMRSHTLIGDLTDRGVLTSFSRPRVSDDNPFSESLFKTIKYDLDCPTRFDSIDHARTWTATFLRRYATEHRHSGLGRHTPADTHHGTAHLVHRTRRKHLHRYYTQHPERFRRPPQPPDLPGPTGINHHKLSQTG